MSGSRLSKRLFQALEWPQDNVKSASEMTEYIKKFKSAQHLGSFSIGEGFGAWKQLETFRKGVFRWFRSASNRFLS